MCYTSDSSLAVTVPQAMRGLLFRSDSRAYDGVARIISLFADERLSKDAARTLLILSRETDGVLSKENFAVIRVSSSRGHSIR